jgi:methylmalonyl-CoA mutase N-terminal domain/subunit
MEALLDLPFEKLQRLTSICNGPQTINLAMIIAALEKRGVDPNSFTLQMPNAILVEYTCVGRYIYPPDHGLRIATDTIEYSIKNHPNWIPISVISAQIYAAYANPVTELAFGFAIAKSYIDAALARGFDIDTLAPYFSFVTGIDMDFFEGVSKLRAYRKVWARIMKEQYGAKDPESMKLRITGSPGTMSLTLQQPLNNIARLGIQMLACAAANGGYAMNTPLHDEAHALPTEETIAVGAGIHHIVAHESGVADTVDPFAGSYYVETMTKQMEDAVFAELEKIDAMGGGLAAIAPSRRASASSWASTTPPGKRASAASRSTGPTPRWRGARSKRSSACGPGATALRWRRASSACAMRPAAARTWCRPAWRP